MVALPSPSSPLLRWAIPFLLCLASIVYFGIFFDFSKPPFEDAAMILRYAQNLAAGHGFVFTPGDPPVDGATDFLFLVATAGLHFLGLTPENAVRLLVGLAHLLTIWVVYRSILRLGPAYLFPAALSAAYLAFGPGLVYFETYFGTPFFVLFVALAWERALILVSTGEVQTRQNIGLFAFFGLVAGLTRPEGVFLVLFMLLTLIGFIPKSQWKRLIAAFVWVFGLPGLLYFLWHWSQFGYPLPNPFYIKGGGSLHWFSAKRSLIHLILMTLPFWVPIALSVRKTTWVSMVKLFIPVVLFTGIWVLMSNAMNYHMRFQYAVLPLVLMAWPMAWKWANGGGLPGSRGTQVGHRAVQGFAGSVPPEAGRHPGGPFHPFPFLRRPLGYAAMAVWALATLGYSHLTNGAVPHSFQDGRKTVGQGLAPYAPKGYSMVISEAGVLPYFSGWRAVDAWGLNDVRIAHSTGTITTAALDTLRPELIMFFGYLDSQKAGTGVDFHWVAMCDTLKSYAQTHAYVLAGKFDDPESIATHNYFVRKDCPDFSGIVGVLDTVRYHWPWTGDVVPNTASVLPQ